jgi:hypothetical protein
MSKKSKSIDEMTQEELNEALQAEVDSLDRNESRYEEKKTEELPEFDEKRPEPKEEKPEPEKEKPLPEEKESNDDGEEPDDDANPYRKRIDKLLRKKDRLEGDNQEKEKTIADLQAKLREAQEGQKSRSEEKSDDSDEDSPASEPITMESIQKTIAESIATALAASESAKAGRTQAEYMDNNELNDLFERIPTARERKSQILELSKEHPKLSFEALDLILSPQDHVDAGRMSANRMAPGARSRADLMSEPDVKTMATHELRAMIEAGISSGEMAV